MEASPESAFLQTRAIAVQDARIRLSTLFELESVEPRSGYVEAWKVVVGLPVSQALTIQIPPRFPFSLPSIFLDNTEQFGRLAHVSPAGHFCYLDQTGVAYDVARIEEAVVEIVSRSIKALSDTVALEAEDEFRREVFAYLPTQGKFLSLLTDFRGQRFVSLLRFEKPTRGEAWFLVAESEEEGRKWLENSGCGTVHAVEEAVFLTDALPGRPAFPSTIGDLERHLREKNPEVSRAWLGEVRRNRVFLTAVESSLGPTLVAWQHQASAFADPKKAPVMRGFRPGMYPVSAEIGRRKTEKLEFFAGQRVDLPRLVGRTDPTSDKGQPRKVLFVGVGALGSHFVRSVTGSLLCRSAAIFDGDTLEVENVLRHTEEFLCVGYGKAFVTGFSLRRKCPWMDVSIYGNALNEFDEYLAEVRTADIVILATGSESVDKFLAQQAFEEGKEGLIVSQAWVESDAKHGHVRVFVKGCKGCPSCWHKARATLQLSEVKQEPGCNTSFATYGGSRLQRFVATGTDFIVNSAIPTDVTWSARKEGELSTDAVELAPFSGKGCAACR